VGGGNGDARGPGGEGFEQHRSGEDWGSGPAGDPGPLEVPVDRGGGALVSGGELGSVATGQVTGDDLLRVEAGWGSGRGPCGYLVVSEPTRDRLRGHRLGGGDLSKAALLDDVEVVEHGPGRSGSAGCRGPSRDPGPVEALVDGAGATAEPNSDLGGRQADR
jgi:hypothetical protein